MKTVSAKDVHSVLAQHMLTDGYDIVLDLEKSQGGYIYDPVSKRRYLDFFTFFASGAIGINHPGLQEPQFLEKLGQAAVNKPSNSDIYTKEMASCVSTFSRLAIPDYLPHLFFISGGTLAVENCLKAAFDWKVRKNFQKGYKEERGQQIIHFRNAFHGRSGYTLSLTNTESVKTDYFPKFDWPRINSPEIIFPLTEKALQELKVRERQSLDQIHQAIKANPDDIAAILIEPIQGEGGDKHFRGEFLQSLRDICDENEILLIFDEVQTGIAMTGEMWCHQHFGVRPDLMAFGKKTQVCGLLASNRLDEVEQNVFQLSNRLNSTFGGNLVDMVRFEKILEIIEQENLVAHAGVMGTYLLAGLNNLHHDFPDQVSNVRGRGLFCAFDLPSLAQRDKLKAEAMQNGLIILGCGKRSIRCRPRLNISEDEIDEAMEILAISLKGAVKN